MILKEDEAFLEHFGIRGMRWGRRTSTPKAPTSKLKRAAKISVGVGVAITATLLLNKRNVRVKEIKRRSGSSEENIVKELLGYNYAMSSPGIKVVKR